ncbi:MAG: hypothetical protein RLZZ516_2321 [Cyanobacteriota bacterium]
MCVGAPVSSLPDDQLNAIADSPSVAPRPGVSWFVAQAADGRIAEARRVRDERAAIRSQLESLAAQRTAEAARQREEMQRLQRATEQARIDQEATVAQLQQQSEQQQQQIAQSRLATQAVASSMKVLSAAPSTRAPAAAVTRPAPVRRGARTTTSPLRIGGTSQAAGAGLNIGG